MSIKRIGVALKEGCTINGADLAIANLISNGMDFDSTYAVRRFDMEYPRNMLHLPEVADLCIRLRNGNAAILSNGDFPLTYGGDHALAIGSIAANKDRDLGVLWIDAHGDSNTEETTITGRLHGMPLAALCGKCHKVLGDLVSPYFLDPTNIVLFGVRDMDFLEEQNIKDWGMHLITMDQIKKEGLVTCLDEALDALRGLKQVHVSFDLDSLNPEVAPGVNTPVVGGLDYGSAKIILKQALRQLAVVSMDVVEYNPIRDKAGLTLDIIMETDRLIQKEYGG
ncbi:MAG: arginase [Erysipelotrichaceae bacterium]|jgi:arginase|nr:arginase [Erysipelotrichaceae bacterium]